MITTGAPMMWEALNPASKTTFKDLSAALDAIDKKWIEKHRAWAEVGPPKDSKSEREKIFTPPKPSDIDKIQNVIDKLRVEEAQLGKTAREQAVYNTLREAGFKIDEATGKFKGDQKKIAQITELTERIFTQKEALAALNAVNQRSMDIMKANQTEQAAWADQLEDLRDLANSGKITWEAYAIAVSKVNVEMAKLSSASDLSALEKMKNAIAALEIQDETPAVRIAQMKADVLREELSIREIAEGGLAHE
jgi:hypothetical protein